MEQQVMKGTGPAMAPYEFRSWLEMLPAAAFTCDTNGLITFCNDKAVELWGRRPKFSDPEDRYCGSFNLLSPDGVPIRHEESWMALALINDKSYREEEILVQRPDGSTRTVIAHATPFHDEFQRIAGSVNVLIDITAQKERELRLEEEHRNKDNFLATLAHELRSPLFPIFNNLEVLRRIRTGRSAFDAPFLAMERQLKHLLRVVDDLMDVSRINRNQLDLDLCSVNLIQVLSDAIDSCRPIVKGQRHSLKFVAPKGELWMEGGDHVRLVQVFVNLITNAAKYTVSPGKIWVVAKASSKEVVVSVRDSGSGLAPEMLGRVFDMFEQAGARERSRGGLGLGLTLTKRLVEMHGGQIEAQSNGLGKGSKFVVRFPLRHSNG